MSTTRSGGRARKRASTFAISGLLAAVAMLVVAGVAMGAADPLKGGSVTLNLKVPKKVKVKSPGGGATVSGKTVTLPIGDPGGSLDPTNGTGAVQPGGTFVLKKGKKKVKISEVVTTFGSTYAGGNISAKVGGKTSTLADLSGGAVSRNGFGGKVDGSNAAVTKGGAKALNKALGLKNKKKNGKKNKNRFKKGKSFGTASTITEPKTVEVISGTSVSHGSTGFVKLAVNPPSYGKGVNPVPGLGIIASDGASYTVAGGPITSPVVQPSSIAPDASAGSVKTGGTIQVKKTVPAAAFGQSCPEDAAHWPLGDFIQFNNTTNDFQNKNVLVDLVLQAPVLGFPAPSPFGSQIPSAHIDMGSATVTSDPNTHTVNIDGFAARNENSAQTGLLNGTFGPSSQGCGVAGSDAEIGDALFTVDMHMVTH